MEASESQTRSIESDSQSGNILIRLKVEEDVVIGIDSRDILQEI